jgi:hypothetical protein
MTPDYHSHNGESGGIGRRAKLQELVSSDVRFEARLSHTVALLSNA